MTSEEQAIQRLNTIAIMAAIFSAADRVGPGEYLCTPPQIAEQAAALYAAVENHEYPAEAKAE